MIVYKFRLPLLVTKCFFLSAVKSAHAGFTQNTIHKIGLKKCYSNIKQMPDTAKQFMTAV